MPKDLAQTTQATYLSPMSRLRWIGASQAGMGLVGAPSAPFYRLPPEAAKLVDQHDELKLSCASAILTAPRCALAFAAPLRSTWAEVPRPHHACASGAADVQAPWRGHRRSPKRRNDMMRPSC